MNSLQFSMAQEEFEKLVKLTGPIKVSEQMHKAVKALAKKHNRKDQDQIRELIKLGIEKEKEKGKPPYPPEDWESLIDRKIEEKFAHYSNAKDGRLAGEPPNRPGHKRQRTG